MLSIKNSIFIALILMQTSKLLISAAQHPPYDLDAMEQEQKKRTDQLRSTIHKFINKFSTTHQYAQALITARNHDLDLLKTAVRKRNPEVFRSQVAAVIHNIQNTEHNLGLTKQRKKFRVRVMDSLRRPVWISTELQNSKYPKYRRALYYLHFYRVSINTELKTS